MGFQSYNVIGNQTRVTSLSSTHSVTIPNGVNGLLVQGFTQDIYYTIDGEEPTSSNAYVLLKDKDPIIIPVSPGRSVVKFKQVTASAELTKCFVRV